MKLQRLKDMIYDLIVMTLKANAPKDTGNLAFNSIQIGEEGIIINTTLSGEFETNYAKKTEESNASSRGWIQRTIESLMPHIENMIKGNFSDEEWKSLMNEAQGNIDIQVEEMAAEIEKGERNI